MRLGILAFTTEGRKLGERVADGLMKSPGRETRFWDPSLCSLKAFVAVGFSDLDGFIFIGALGIAVRVTAPHLSSKAQDPAVVVLDEAGRYVIPVLSSHLGGANPLALEIAGLIGAEPVITTATDVRGRFAVDTWSREQGCEIVEPDRIKYITGALLAGEPVGVCSEFEMPGPLPVGLTRTKDGPLGICITFSEQRSPFELTLHVIPKRVILGIGCRRGTAFEALEAFILKTLARENLSIRAVSALHSIALKKDEPCLVRFSKAYGIPFKTFSANALRAVPGSFSPSNFVKEITGVDNVCERSAMAVEDSKAEPGALAITRRLILSKQKEAGMTLAAACEDWRCIF